MAAPTADEVARREASLQRLFLIWTFMRAASHRGYVLVSSLYFVLTAHLAAPQLLLLGTAVSAALLLADIPAGAWSDAVSRKWPLVIGHCFLAAGMLLTGLVTAFAALLIAQLLWGLGWAFSSGADVAWITDETGQSPGIDRVLTARARFDLLGSVCGMIALGLLAWATSLTTAVLVSGAAMALVGVFVARRFSEDNFVAHRHGGSLTAISVFRKGALVITHDRTIVAILASTVLINAASQVAWLFPKQLVRLGFSSNTVLAYTVVLLVAFLFGAGALRVLETRIHREGVAEWTYVAQCLLAALGLVVLAYAATAAIGSIGVIVAYGIAFNVTRAVSVVWINRRVTSDVRATVHSFLGQSEYLGEVLAGFGLAGIAKAAGITTTLDVSAGLAILAAVVILLFGIEH